MQWEYRDATGTLRRGRFEGSSDRGGTDVTYFMRRSTGELDLLSGQRLREARTVPASADTRV